MYFISKLLICIILTNIILGIRNYQIIDKAESHATAATNIQLIEIGPRFVLVPIRIFNGSLGGATLYQNTAYITPNAERSQLNRHKGNTYKARIEHMIQKKQYDEENKHEINELSNSYLFKDKSNVSTSSSSNTK